MKNDEICCQKFNPSTLDNKRQTWNNKLFVRASMPQVLHMPLPGFFGKTIQKMTEAVSNSKSEVSLSDYLLLSEDISSWKSCLYLHVAKEVPGLDNVKLSGVFLSKVFDGDYSNIPRFITEMNKYVEDQGEKIINYYFYYTTCPKCAKKYEHNYIVIFAKIS